MVLAIGDGVGIVKEVICFFGIWTILGAGVESVFRPLLVSIWETNKDLGAVCDQFLVLGIAPPPQRCLRALAFQKCNSTDEKKVGSVSTSYRNWTTFVMLTGKCPSHFF